MRIYQVMYITDKGTYHEWARNMKEAKKERTRVIRSFKDRISFIHITRYEDVPRNKTGFLRLLNAASLNHHDLMELIREEREEIGDVEAQS